MGQVESGICGLARLCYQVLRPGMVRKMTDFYNALDEHEFSEGMPEYQAIVNY